MLLIQLPCFSLSHLPPALFYIILACLGYLLRPPGHLFIVWLCSNLAISVFLHLLNVHCSPSSTRPSIAHLALQNSSSGSISQLIYLSTLLEPPGKSAPWSILPTHSLSCTDSTLLPQGQLQFSPPPIMSSIPFQVSQVP